MQGFKDGDNNFIQKEIIKPPYKWKYLDVKSQSSNNWVSKCHYALEWESYSTYFKDVNQIVNNILKEEYGKILVKGEEKVKWCEQLFNINVYNVENLQDFDKEKYNNIDEKLLTKCFFHGKNCALVNVFKILNSYEE